MGRWVSICEQIYILRPMLSRTKRRDEQPRVRLLGQAGDGAPAPLLGWLISGLTPERVSLLMTLLCGRFVRRDQAEIS